MGIRTILCVFSEERRIKKLWCVFWVAFICFFVFERGEKCLEKPGREKNSKKKKLILSSVWRVSGAFYSLGTNFEAAAIQGLPPSNFLGWVWSWHFWKGLDFLFLKMYGSWKSNDQIKSYGSQKLVVHWSMCYPSFHDISTFLTPILTYE